MYTSTSTACPCTTRHREPHQHAWNGGSRHHHGYRRTDPVLHLPHACHSCGPRSAERAKLYLDGSFDTRGDSCFRVLDPPDLRLGALHFTLVPAAAVSATRCRCQNAGDTLSRFTPIRSGAVPPPERWRWGTRGGHVRHTAALAADTAIWGWFSTAAPAPIERECLPGPRDPAWRLPRTSA